jgi:phosphohistidine phosphatase
MTVYFVRHGIAEDPGFLKADSERVLTQEGIAELHSVGRGFAQLQPNVSTIISSPFLRAKQTAEILAEKIAFKKGIQFDKRLVPSADFNGLQELFQELDIKDNVMFVGHEPSMSGFVSAISSDNALRLAFKKGAICCVEITNRRTLRGELLWYAPPRVLMK